MSHRTIAMDGNLADVVKGMSGVLAERNGDVCEWGCRALMNLARIDEANRIEVQDANGIIAIGKSLKQHPTHHGVQQFACKALMYLAETLSINESLEEHGCVSGISTIIESDDTGPVSLSAALLAVAAVCKAENNRDLLAQHGSGQRVVTIMEEKVNEVDVLLACCQAVVGLTTQCDLSRKAIGQAGVDAIINALELHDSPIMLRRACEALDLLAVDPELSRGIADCGAMDLVLRKMGLHITSAEAQKGGCRAIARLAQMEENREKLLAAGAMEIMVKVMEKHVNDIDVQLYSCWAMVELSAGDGEEKFEKVVDAILHSMEKHVNNKDVHRYGCKALENLGSRTEEQRVEIGEKNGVVIILAGVKEHKDEPHVQANAFHALAVLAGSDEKMHVHITQLFTVTYIREAMTTHAAAEHVQHNACRLLANLALTAKVREYIIKEKIPKLILKAAQKHQKDANTSHYACWALENLSFDDKIRMKLMEAKLDLIAQNLMTIHLEDADVQISGMRLLERLCFNANNQVCLAPTSAECVLNGMNAHNDDGEVQHCGCAALASLALNVKNKDTIVALGGISIIMSAVTSFPLDELICQYAAGTIGTIAFKSEKNKERLTKEDVVKHLVDIMKNHQGHVEVCVAACSALRNITARADAKAKALQCKAHATLIQLLELHKSNPDMVYWSANALNNLCKDQEIAAAVSESTIREVCKSLDVEKSSKTYAAIIEMLARLPKQQPLT